MMPISVIDNENNRWKRNTRKKNKNKDRKEQGGMGVVAEAIVKG